MREGGEKTVTQAGETAYEAEKASASKVIRVATKCVAVGTAGIILGTVGIGVESVLAHSPEALNVGVSVTDLLGLAGFYGGTLARVTTRRGVKRWEKQHGFTPGGFDREMKRAAREKSKSSGDRGVGGGL